MTNVVQLGSFGADDEEYSGFIDRLKDDVDNAVFIVEKTNGEVFVGCNFENRKDLVFALYKLQGLIQNILEGDN